MHVAELWVYPVKSLAGQPLQRATIGADGIPGDRRVQVRDGDDRLVTARTRHRLLALRATLDAGGCALVDGVPWRDPAALAAVRDAVADDDARLIEMNGDARFDDTTLLIATDGAVQALGVDRRRLRPNILIAGVEGLAERGWPGGRLRVGSALIDVEKVCKRCVMTTLDPDTQAVSPDVLRRINADYDGRFALNCWVAEPGEVAVGDPVELV
ncbi:MOSC domain-containing protein [Conexibacter sp. CPCC 206217]|uniref:MOSC domain-containing protein n=1 Tax=Conexibacter sp. CPCC 206217 TaxID=3064574 RepID=UPI002719762F|nr:MOSC N-terminal beta barrel domain-containing protein [Conexibacter sp. CPCC 206217]MDO8212689.1 MOSC domain-containing protein [Conexibacter sp. CPCC 206217]